MVELPYDAWILITDYLPDSQVRNFYGLNRPLFHIAMDLRYREASISSIHPLRQIRGTDIRRCRDQILRPKVIRIQPKALAESIIVAIKSQHTSTSLLNRTFSKPGRSRRTTEAVQRLLDAYIEEVLFFARQLVGVTTVTIEDEYRADLPRAYTTALQTFFVDVCYILQDRITKLVVRDVPSSNDDQLERRSPLTKLLNNLKTFHIPKSTGGTPAADLFLQRWSHIQPPNLRSLELELSDWPPTQDLHAYILQFASSLTSLILRGTVHHKYGDLLEFVVLLKRFKSLQRLHLHVPVLNPAILANFATNHPRLYSLHIQYGEFDEYNRRSGAGAQSFESAMQQHLQVFSKWHLRSITCQAGEGNSREEHCLGSALLSNLPNVELFCGQTREEYAAYLEGLSPPRVGYASWSPASSLYGI